MTEPTKPHGEGCCEVDAPVTGPRIVSPEEAQAALDACAAGYWASAEKIGNRLARTVATEPDRTRAAVVGELRRAAVVAGARDELAGRMIDKRADALENGAAF
jgi:hypothetical protein